LGTAAGVDRHIPKTETGVESEKDIGNLWVKGGHEFYNKMKLFSVVGELSHLKKKKSPVWG
jgi:hypothetical protein